MKTAAVILLVSAVLVISGCSTIAGLPEITQRDAKTAAEIALEWNDQTGFDCFSVLAERKVIAPTGPLSTIAAARAARLGRPQACDSVILDAQRRITPWGF